MSKRTCDIPECNGTHVARGLCSTHYNQAHQPNRHKDSVAQSRDRRERDQLDPFKMDKERARNRRRNWSGLDTITNELPDWVEAEIDRLEATRMARCARCLSPFLTTRPRQSFCSLNCKTLTTKSRRRAAKRGSTGHHTRSEVLAVWESIGRTCAYCHEHIEAKDMQADHFIALARGGHNGMGNMVPACLPCNGDKRELSVHEWSEDRARRNLEPRFLCTSITHLESGLTVS